VSFYHFDPLASVLGASVSRESGLKETHIKNLELGGGWRGRLRPRRGNSLLELTWWRSIGAQPGGRQPAHRALPTSQGHLRRAPSPFARAQPFSEKFRSRKKIFFEALFFKLGFKQLSAQDFSFQEFFVENISTKLIIILSSFCGKKSVMIVKNTKKLKWKGREKENSKSLKTFNDILMSFIHGNCLCGNK